MKTGKEIASFSDDLKALALAQGFSAVGISPAVTPTGYHRLLEWLQQGYHAEMHWMEQRKEARRHPESMLPGTCSLLVVALNYHEGTPHGDGARVSRYAWGTADYHEIVKARLKPVAELIRRQIPAAKTRIVTDSAPLLERDFGRMAGIGWSGKNTMLISRSIGSWFFLGALLTDAELHYDAAEDSQYCGSCTRCLEACPTQAFPEPGVLDAAKCISYLTIELRKQPIPRDLREGLGRWIFGCDICQDVCPWNRFAPSVTVPEFGPQDRLISPDCRALLRMSADEFVQTFGDTPLSRPGYAGVRRNAAIVLGNVRDRDSEPELMMALTDESVLVRGAAAWALCQLGSPGALNSVWCQLEKETDITTLEDMRASLSEVSRRVFDPGG
jgi:epoxyqueuosine reductase